MHNPHLCTCTPSSHVRWWPSSHYTYDSNNNNNNEYCANDAENRMWSNHNENQASKKEITINCRSISERFMILQYGHVWEFLEGASVSSVWGAANIVNNSTIKVTRIQHIRSALCLCDTNTFLLSSMQSNSGAVFLHRLPNIPVFNICACCDYSAIHTFTYTYQKWIVLSANFVSEHIGAVKLCIDSVLKMLFDFVPNRAFGIFHALIIFELIIFACSLILVIHNNMYCVKISIDSLEPHFL